MLKMARIFGFCQSADIDHHFLIEVGDVNIDCPVHVAKSGTVCSLLPK